MAYLEILQKPQQKILKLLQEPRFSVLWQDFYLAGGTGFALQLGHRISIDFDFFTYAESLPGRFALKIKKLLEPNAVVVNTAEQFSFIKDKVNITFLAYPFKLQTNVIQDLPIKLATIHSIAAAKAYTIGRRAKWKDYVDVFVYIKLFGLEQLQEHATKIFGDLFSEKLFVEQLCYFEDIDFSEEIVWNGNAPEEIKKHVWQKETPPTEKEIQRFLCSLKMI